MSPRPDLVHLPSGIDVERRGVWLHESCPSADEHSPFPADFNPGTGRSKTHLQAKHQVCGLWALWIPRAGPSPGPPNPPKDREYA